MSIKIFTEFHPSTTTAINSGEVQEIKEFKLTSRGLISANTFLSDHVSKMIVSWGNEGHVKSWITINGHEIGRQYCDDSLFILDKHTPKEILNGKTRTEHAEILIKNIQMQ